VTSNVFADLELHSAMPIAWIVAGLIHLDFINPGHIQVKPGDCYPGQQVSSSDLVTMLIHAIPKKEMHSRDTTVLVNLQ